ncbi:MAG TPA: TadE family protein [Bryobacteraceae bacterium]|nr:TadE family protein [Bryobacteraceae bacterium]
MEPAKTVQGRRAARARRRRGSELLEFTLVLLPLLAMITVLVDTAWAVFAEATLQRAVRIGVRTGVTLTASSPQIVAAGDLTTAVKDVVQTNSFGLLGGSSGFAKIKVNYYLPPAPSSTSAATDVSTQSNGDAAGNIMVVSVQNFSLNPLMPRIYSSALAIDNAPLVIANVNSADMIEPSRNPPPIGTAP